MYHRNSVCVLCTSSDHRISSSASRRVSCDARSSLHFPTSNCLSNAFFSSIASSHYAPSQHIGAKDTQHTRVTHLINSMLHIHRLFSPLCTFLASGHCSFALQLWYEKHYVICKSNLARPPVVTQCNVTRHSKKLWFSQSQTKLCCFVGTLQNTYRDWRRTRIRGPNVFSCAQGHCTLYQRYRGIQKSNTVYRKSLK